MARLKKTSAVITAALTRTASLESSDPKLDLGNGLTLDTFRKSIQTATDNLDAYNKLLSDADVAAGVFAGAESALGDMSSRMLAGVAAKYGKDSPQYQQAGGTRTSDIKRSPRKAKLAPVAK